MLRNRDFNVQSFRSNLVLRWEWRAGQHAVPGLAAGSIGGRDHCARARPSPTCSARSDAPATISSRSRRASGSRPARPRWHPVACGPWALFFSSCSCAVPAPGFGADRARTAGSAPTPCAWPMARFASMDGSTMPPGRMAPPSDRLRPEGARRGRAAQRPHGGPLRLRRRRAVRRRAHVFGCADPGADGTAGQRRSGGALRRVSRHLSGPAHRVDIRRDGGGRAGSTSISERQRRGRVATFDPVWLARTSIDAQGWTAELRIPFSQLRFTDRDPQVWGLNVKRWVPSRNEEVYWALVAADRGGMGVAVRRPAWHQRHQAEPADRAAALRSELVAPVRRP